MLGDEQLKWWIAIACFCILLPMMLVRKVQTFARLHLVGDVLIAFVLIVVVGYALKSVTTQGWQN